MTLAQPANQRQSESLVRQGFAFVHELTTMFKAAVRRCEMH